MTDKTDPKPRLSLTLRVVFALSLGLNLLVAGVVAGAWWRGAPHDGPRAGGPAALYLALPREERRALRAELRGTIDRDSLHLRAPLMAALRADPFDPGALAATLAAQSDALAQAQTRMRALWLDRIAAMSPAERAAYADRLQAVWERQRQ